MAQVRFPQLSQQALDYVMGGKIKSLLDLQQLSPGGYDLAELSGKRVPTLYIHIPFCHTLCRFCSFFRLKYDEAKAREYFKLLRQEVEILAQVGVQFDRLYIGGGTTTIIESELIETIELIKSRFDIQEVSCESDPIYFENSNPLALKGLVDRFSIGIQSFDDEILKHSGRYEKFGSGDAIADLSARAIAEFPTINLDMMMGFNNQTPDALTEDLMRASALKPGQITLYPLTLGVGKNRKKAGKLAGNPADLLGLYQTGRNVLEPGYEREYAWTYRRATGLPVEHDYVLDGEDCVGIGCGAFGRIGNKFYLSSFNLDDYARRVKAGELSCTSHKDLSTPLMRRYHLLMMMVKGHLPNSVFEKLYGRSLYTALPAEMAFLRLHGAIVPSACGDGYRTTPTGEFVALKMFSGFLAGMDWLREQAGSAAEEAQIARGQAIEVQAA
ncbi:coproporphyrinogen III oxidase family protein [Ferrimonas marina]|uniref:Coproporphyrinogen III oxidase n=1 Tax=Ferrimonas marina TaxID=299255 RepID=A0A1M5XT65_9GAMM|nr:coproporphyrinogen III oxidase family protein [Ferrimonas marina]SHI02453.1 Coproporphyrinogen III oxidase [Ferrimonas marina]